VDARNAVVAAWLWRRFAVTTPFAANPIVIISWCGAIHDTSEPDADDNRSGKEGGTAANHT